MRIEITLPERFIFSTQIQVRASDINYGGHLGNDSVLTLLQEARVLFYKSMGFRDEARIDGDVGQIIADFIVQYKSESFMGDVLDIRLAIDNLHKYGFEMLYQVVHEKGREVARAKSNNLCFDYGRRKIASVPGTFVEKINQLLN